MSIKKFNNIYKTLFQKNDLVICWNNILDWSYSPLESNNEIMIRQKVWIYSYIWINISKNTYKIEIKNVLNYDCKSDTFINSDCIKINSKKDEVLKVLKDFLVENDFNYWLEITYLSEISKWHWFWQLWVWLTLLTLWVYIILWKISINELENLEKSRYFNEIYDFSTKLISISTSWFTLWANNYSFLIKNKNPILFEKKDDKINITNIFSEENLDFWILYFWLDEEFDELRKKINHNKKYLDEEYLLLVNKIWKKLKNDLFLSFNDIYNDFLNHNFQNNLINTINKNNTLLNLIQKENKVIEYFKYLFENNKKLQNEEIWILQLNSSSDGWSFIFILKDKISRYTIENSIIELSKKYYVFKDYISWENVENIWSPKVKQYISKWIISDYIDISMVYYFDNLWNKKIWKIEDIILEEKDWIILDTINKKILINWKKIDSKTIKSQSFTIDMMILLIENITKDVPNSLFPFSSYKNDRNQIQWKIIIPFLKLIKEFYLVDLKIKCIWNYDNFVLNMDKTHLKIWFIKNIN